jgi:HME family heavy-metal exporter
LGPLEFIAKATLEVRSGIVIATVIIVLVLLPLFFLPGIEGRLMQPLAIAYIVSLLASMVVSVTLTPVMSYYLLPQHQRAGPWRHQGPSLGQVVLRECRLDQVFWPRHAPGWPRGPYQPLLAMAGNAAVFPTTFLPPFNEGVALVGLRLNPGTTLTETTRIGSIAEKALAGVPEVEHVGRRSGRAELDEHAEGVHVSELDVKLKRSDRSLEAVYADIRSRIASLPAAIGIGQPIGHRIDHMLSGVRSQIAIKIFGDDLDVLACPSREPCASSCRQSIGGVVDLEMEKQVLTPQIKVQVDYDRALGMGIHAGQTAGGVASVD